MACSSTEAPRRLEGDACLACFTSADDTTLSAALPRLLLLLLPPLLRRGRLRLEVARLVDCRLLLWRCVPAADTTLVRDRWACARATEALSGDETSPPPERERSSSCASPSRCSTSASSSSSSTSRSICSTCAPPASPRRRCLLRLRLRLWLWLRLRLRLRLWLCEWGSLPCEPASVVEGRGCRCWFRLRDRPR